MGVRGDEQHAIGAQQKSRQMEGQSDDQGKVLTLLQATQQATVKQGTVFKGFPHAVTLQPAAPNVKKNLLSQARPPSSRAV